MRINLPSIQLPPDPASHAGVIASIYNTARGIIVGKLLRVPSVQFVEVVSPAVADTPFIVSHGLQVTPVMFAAQTEVDARCYATAADKLEWSIEQIKIRCTVADAFLLVEVKAR